MSPALRRICLPYVPATPSQISNVVLALKGRGGSVLDIGSGDGRIVIILFNSLANKLYSTFRDMQQTSNSAIFIFDPISNGITCQLYKNCIRFCICVSNILFSHHLFLNFLKLTYFFAYKTVFFFLPKPSQKCRSVL